jgi:sirohydrochlorin ferrochelatase
MEAAPTDRAVVVLVAHGSRAEAANEAHRMVAAELARRTGRTVVPAFLELAEPSIPDAIVAAVGSGAGEVLVLPHFLYPGRHLAEDVPALVAEAARARPGASIVLLPPSGADPAMVDLLADQVDRAVGDEGPPAGGPRGR